MSDHEIISFLNRLKGSDVRLSLEGEHLGVVFEGEQDEVLLGEIREHKTSLLRFLQNVSVTENDLQVMHGEEMETYPLAHAQKRIWLHEKMEPGNQAYYIHADVMIKGSLDAALLQASLDRMVDKHEALRTVFLLEAGEPAQRILPPGHVDTQINAVSFNNTFNQYHHERILEHRQGISFNLETGPLFSLQWYRFRDEVHILSFCIHHIISDAQSLSVFIHDLIGVYQQLKSDHDFVMAPLPLQFRDFCQWEEKHRGLESFRKDRAYWMEVFATEPAAIALPYASERKHFKTYKGLVQEARIDKELAAAIQQYYRSKGTTPFVFFYASVQALLYRYTEQNDLTLGTSVHGRDNAVFRDQIGLYARTLPLRLRFAEDADFSALMDLSQVTVEDALAHQRFPFDQLVEECAFVRDPSRSPFFDIMIDYFAAAGLPQVQDMECSTVKFPHFTSKFDLTFTFLEDAAGLNLRVEYNTDLFTKEFISQLLSHYNFFLKQLLSSPDQPVYKLPLLDSEQKNNLLCTWGCGPDEMKAFAPIKELLEATAACCPSRDAIQCGETLLTYAALHEQANRLAHYLQQKLGNTRNRIVGIMLERTEHLMISVIAVIKSGAAFVPVDPEAPVQYRKHILSDSGADLLITATQWLPDLSEMYSGELFAVDVELDTLETPAVNPAASIQPDDLAYILYTSGSTGAPKGVEIMQRNISNYLQWAASYYYKDLGQTRVPWFTSFAFDLSLTCMFTPLMRGDLLELYPKPNASDAFLQMLNSGNEFGLMKITPSHINVLGVLDIGELKVKRVIVGGEELTAAHIQILKNAHPSIRVFNEYGPTETTVGCTVEEVSANDITIGQPMPNTSVYILNKAGQLMPQGFWGEIVVGGAGVARGYRNRPELTAARFVKDHFVGGASMYRTGDIGRWLPDGRLACKGRADHQVKINGFRIELGEIEGKMQQLPGIDHAAVLVQQAEGTKTLIAFFAGDDSLDANALRKMLGDHLPVYMVPAQYIHVTSWPLTVNGKTDKAALLAMAKDAPERVAAARPPETDHEKELAAFFEELLPVKQIGVDENLFSLGLDSLKAIRVQAMLEEKYPGRVQIHDIFSHSTIGKLAIHIHGQKVKEKEVEIIDF
jgi:amino acid adenylation domain-containing protein